MAKTINPDFSSANAINPAIADIRDEQAAQGRKILRMEAIKIASGIASINGEPQTTKEIIDSTNHIYNYLEFGTTMTK